MHQDFSPLKLANRTLSGELCPLNLARCVLPIEPCQANARSATTNPSG
jgi:hypothetical protein